MMKNVRSAALVAALSCAAATGAELPDGLYDGGSSTAGQKIVAQDGAQGLLGLKSDLKVERAEIQSKSNQNDKFLLSIEVPPTPTEDLVKSNKAQWLSVNGTVYRATGWGGGEKTNIYFNIAGKKNGDEVARYFGVQPRFRKHPGYKLAVSFVPAKDKFAVGEDAWVTLRIENVGENAVTFTKGGRNRAQRDNQYTFRCTYSGQQVADVGNDAHEGGLAQDKVVKPGEVFEDKVDLKKWFAFDKPGMYAVLGSYYMSFSPPEGALTSAGWEDYATAAFTVTIEKEKGAAGKPRE